MNFIVSDVFQINVTNYHHVDVLVSVRNNEYFGNALYMMMREHDITLEPDLESVLGFIEADFSHLSPQPCDQCAADRDFQSKKKNETSQWKQR